MVRGQGIMEIPPQAELRLTLGSLMTSLGPFISKHCEEAMFGQSLFLPQKHLTCPTKTRGALKICSYSLLIDGSGWLLPYIRVYNKCFLNSCDLHNSPQLVLKLLTDAMFVFEGIDEGSLNGALDRAFSHYREKPNELNDVTRKIIEIDHSWNKTAEKYLDVYNSIRGMKSQCDEKMSDFVFCKTRIVKNFLERCKIWSKNSRT
ncbi:hypothetical protein ACSBR2_023122 [Camellia fascicularis]